MDNRISHLQYLRSEVCRRRVDLYGFEVRLVVSIKFMIFWDVMPCRLVNEGSNTFFQNTGTSLRNQMRCRLLLDGHNPEGMGNL
jgi:hypothetical protein